MIKRSEERNSYSVDIVIEGDSELEVEEEINRLYEQYHPIAYGITVTRRPYESLGGRWIATLRRYSGE